MPFSFLQVLAWIMAIFIIICFILTEICLLTADQRDKSTLYVCTILGGAYVIAFLLLVIQTVLVTASDPTDPTVKLHRLNRESLQAFKAGS